MNLIFRNHDRILLASIRNMGRCPCPQCIIPLSRVHNLGTVTDMQNRVTLACIDDQCRQSSVSAARKLIYDEHHQVNSKAVETLLQETSLVPNIVRIVTAIIPCSMRN